MAWQKLDTYSVAPGKNNKPCAHFWQQNKSYSSKTANSGSAAWHFDKTDIYIYIDSLKRNSDNRLESYCLIKNGLFDPFGKKQRLEAMPPMPPYISFNQAVLPMPPYISGPTPSLRQRLIWADQRFNDWWH
jgi:hypothetical protein